jgi:DNA repair protein RecO (recombination protein O)
VVLRGRQLGEADRIVTLFTRERGKLDAVAKGVRRARSHFAGRLEFGNECDLLMHRGRSLDVIVSAEIISSKWSQLVEPEHYAVASVVAEIVDAFCEPDLALPDVYELLQRVFAAIAASPAPRELLPRFSLRLLDMLGLAPPLTTCIHCGAPLGDGPVWLDAEAGGILGAACRERWRDLPELEAHDVQNLRALAVAKESGSAAALRATPAAAAAAELLVAHHLGRRPKALAALGSLGSAP